MKNHFTLYQPKTGLDLQQSREFVHLERLLEENNLPYQLKEWGHTFDQVGVEYTPTIDVYSEETKTKVSYTCESFNTYFED